MSTWTTPFFAQRWTFFPRWSMEDKLPEKEFYKRVSIEPTPDYGELCK